MTASHYGLSSLLAVVDRNQLQQGARTEETKQLEPLVGKWVSFGWEVREVDGHDHAQLLDTFRRPGTARPVCVMAHTVKGNGVSFMEPRASRSDQPVGVIVTVVNDMRLGLIGLGRIGSFHAETLTGLPAIGRSGAPLGDAMLAGVAVGVFPDFSVAKERVQYVELLEPDDRDHQIYQEFFAL